MDAPRIFPFQVKDGATVPVGIKYSESLSEGLPEGRDALIYVNHIFTRLYLNKLDSCKCLVFQGI